MSLSPPPGTGRLPLSAARAVDRLGTQFEAAWLRGERPCIEEFLADVPEPIRPALLVELVAVEAEHWRRAGP